MTESDYEYGYDTDGDEYRLLPAVKPLSCSDADKLWLEMQQYVAERIATVFQITMEELGVITNKE